MPIDSERRGHEVAAIVFALAPRAFADLIESDPWLEANVADLARAAAEWELFALYAGVRGLVAAGGFNRETAAAIDALHEAASERWTTTLADAAQVTAVRARVSERYAEYGAIGQAGGKAGAATVAPRLGAAAARHMLAAESAPPELADMIGALHEALAEGIAERLRG